MSTLTIHVLDVNSGCSVHNLKVAVSCLHDHGEELCTTAITGEDGRTEAPLLSANDFPTGRYTLHFYVGDYFAAMKVPQSDPRFLDIVRVDIGVANRCENYHIQLIITPWSYSIYRGG